MTDGDLVVFDEFGSFLCPAALEIFGQLQSIAQF